jgi:hypothetical protein
MNLLRPSTGEAEAQEHEGRGMADHHHETSGDIAEHLATYHGFLTLLKVGTAASVVTLLLMYFFLAR